ncbi:MAG TPA: radical SAM protein [Bryobacteraceae bacterium]|nr:radical SAM protein [Bryobacteraceae bacterium]
MLLQIHQQPAPVKLVGIARLAAQSSLLTEKSRVEYRTLPTRKWLNRCHSDRVPFHWTINPYRGCEYGCKYCYARFTHEFLERRDPAAFETEIYAKDWDPLAFQDELKAVKPGQVIALGTATDPYQPAERKFDRTRQVLEALTSVRGASVFVTTKSDLVSRDAALFLAISKHNDVRISVSVTTTNRTLARLIEPYAPRPDLRLKAVAELSRAGISVSVIASPILPLLTDSEKNLSAVAEAAKAAGASCFGANILFLQPAAQRVFFPFLAEKFPRHLGRYEKSYHAGAYLKGAYPDRIGSLLNDIRQRVGIPARDFSTLPVEPNPQLLLF